MQMKSAATGPAIRRDRLIAATCVAALLTAAGGAAQAQAAGDDEATAVEELVVTGIRRGIADSLSIKRKETSIVEAVSAEDIGKLPDVSIAESLARLPGLTGQRVNGRVQVISIRGLSPDFSTTLLNGRQQVSTSDNRAAEFDQYPSELIASAVIYKTPDAGLIGQGLAGTADMRTVRPLDFDRRTFAVGLRGETNSLGDLNSNTSENGGRFSISYIDQFADGTIGLALGYAHLDSPSQIQHYKAWWWDTQGDLFGAPNTDAMGLQGAEVEAISRRQVRDGLMGVLEFRPNDRVHSTIDVFYSKFDQRETMRGMMWYQSHWADQLVFSNTTFETINGTKVNTAGTVSGVTPIVRNDYNTRDDEMFAIGANNQLAFGGWDLVADFGYSTVERKEQVLETYAGRGPIRTFDTLTYRVPHEGVPTFSTGFDYSDPATIVLGDPAPWGGWGHDGTIRFPEVKDTLATLRLSGEYGLEETFLGGLFGAVDIGIDYAKRTKEKTVSDNNLFLLNGRAPVAVSSDLLQAPTSLSFGGIPRTLAYDVMGALSKYYRMEPIDNADQWNKDWEIEEALTTAYAKLDLDTAVFGVPLRGNIGVQAVWTEQESTGYNVNRSSQTTPVAGTVSASYTDVLPSMNLVFDLGSGQLLRFAAAKTMARPRMDELRASVTAGLDVTTRMWSGSGGNPELRPWRATAFDLSYEKYFSKGSYIGVAAFYKDLESYIYTQNRVFDFSAVPNNSNVTPISNLGLMSQPVNGEGGKVEGVELSGALEGELISPWLKGFGVIGSWSRTHSNIRPDGPGSLTKLPGLSGTVYNITAYYEQGGFSTRISQRYRSAFRGEVNQLFATRGYTEILADEQIDFQASYSFQDGRWNGLTVLFQVNNLTDAPYQTRTGTAYSNGSYIPETYETYGRQFLFGVSYRM